MLMLGSGCIKPPSSWYGGEIYPSVMINNSVFTWKQLVVEEDEFGIPLKSEYLPEGYTYLADIEHIEGDKLYQNYQFISEFDISGKIYINPSTPDLACLCVTTSWLQDTFVYFEAKRS